MNGKAKNISLTKDGRAMPKRNYQKKADVSCVIFSLLRITVILLGVLIWMASAVPAGAKVRVSTFSELSKELKGKEKKTIVIEDDIIVTKTLTSQGTKILTSNGCSIKRSTSDGKAFYGSLIKVVGGSLSLRGVSLQGGGAVAKGKLYGYLVDLAGGQLSLRDGTVLKNNKNSSKATDGGGAVRVRSGGTLVLNGGKITNNSSVAGGAAIRVDRGGSFYMKSGTISDNICVGRSRVSGFEGRGGAICNYGTDRKSVV